MKLHTLSRCVRLTALSMWLAMLPGCLVHIPTPTVVHLHDPQQPEAEAVTLGLEETVWFEEAGTVTVLGRGQDEREHEWHLPWLDRSENVEAYRWLRMQSTDEPGRWQVELAVSRELWPGDVARVPGLPNTRRIQLAGETTMPADWPVVSRRAELERVELHHVDRPAIQLHLTGTLAPRQRRDQP
ncbi:MAG: hypothetical protein WD534_02165 [Phycisphaeraceae bacterium]